MILLVAQFGGLAYAQEAVVTYDNFNSSLLINPHKWLADDFRGLEAQRSIQGVVGSAALRLDFRSYAATTSNSGSQTAGNILAFPHADPAIVRVMGATFTVQSFQSVGCAANTVTPTSAGTDLFGFFFNAGPKVVGSAVNVLAYVLVAEASSANDHRLVRVVVFSPRAGEAASALTGSEPGGETIPVGVPAALTALEAAAKQGDVETLGTLARELLAGPDRSEALARLLAVARRPEPPTRLLALQLLHDARESGPAEVLKTIGGATADADLGIKGWAIQALAEWTEPDAAWFLRGALRDPDSAVRMQVVESLARTEEGRLMIGEALGDEDPAIRAFARFWLEQDAPEGEAPPNS